jgi:copper chaperone CopZ
MQTATFRTEPFTCPSCVKKIEGAVGRIPGVSLAEVGFSSSRVKVSFDPGVVEPERIARTITDLGYPVLSTRVRS